ncbi:serine/threonine protein kinase [Pseudomonas inefficax]|uniref:serine/threonine protein kinase n=1 Tax=Pseudomonas inefficax TaxID=2078786 RepID=UPI004046B4D7
MSEKNSNNTLKSAPKSAPNVKTLNGWRYDTEEPLGSGGNGVVYAASKKGQQGALKMLKSRNHEDRLARFRDEVAALRACSDIPGVIPVLDADTNPPENSKPWLVMALATPLQNKLGENPTLKDIVEAVLGVAVVLETMHARGYSHRDIKPDNLFFYDGKWTVGDFGLVSFSGKTGETAPHERLGPIHYIAPEMLNTAAKADGAPADVFSLAKTLWVLATGQKYPLPGVYDLAFEACRIETYLSGALGASQLNKLIATASSLAPEKRPTMSQMCVELRAWLEPKPESTLEIQFNTSEYDSLIEVSASSHEVQQTVSAQEQEQLKETTISILNKLSRFFANIISALRHRKLSVDFMEWNQNRSTASIRAAIENNNKATITLTMSDFTLQNGYFQFLCQIIMEWSSTKTRVLTWNYREKFLQGGSQEDFALESLQKVIFAEIQKALDQFLAITFPDNHPASACIFNIVDQSNNPIHNATVCLIDIDGASYIESTDESGSAVMGPYPISMPIAYIAHPNYHAEFFPKPHGIMKVKMTEAASGGSFIYINSAPNLASLRNIQLIHDEQSRTYMYASGSTLDYGARPPAYVALGRDTHIKDKSGNCVHLRPRAVRGGTFLLDFTNLPTAFS